MSAGDGPLAAEIYPSIAATAVGRLVGRLMNLSRVSFWRVPISYLVFGPLAAGVGAAAYLIQKVAGVRYRVSETTVEEWPAVGVEATKTVRLRDIEAATIVVRSGQAFFDAGDVVVTADGGAELMRLSGVVRPNRVRSVILDACRSRSHAEAVRKAVQSRG